MPVQEIYGVRQDAAAQRGLRKVVDRLSADGFVIDQLTFNSALRLPDNVVGAINRAMEATQNAIQAENRVRQIRAEADQAGRPPPAARPRPPASAPGARPTRCSSAPAPRRRPTRSSASR
jgi:regulator of protease activity HflC (stomatin/prohibitin superfamily)